MAKSQVPISLAVLAKDLSAVRKLVVASALRDLPDVLVMQTSAVTHQDADN
jgi:hypothetical protein